MRIEFFGLRPRPADEKLMNLSRKLNFLLNKKNYMLCSYIYLMLSKGKIKGFSVVLYITAWYLIDGFFRIWSHQKHHCADCAQYEMLCTKRIPKEDIE